MTTRFILLLTAAACLYPTGEAMQQFGIGPNFIRWHLSDVGFPAALSVVWAAHRHVDAKPESLRSNLSDEEAVRKYSETLLRSIPVFVLLAIGFEYLSGAYYAIADMKQGYPVARSGIGDFDPIDVACYVAGGVVAFAIARYFSLQGKAAATSKV